MSFMGNIKGRMALARQGKGDIEGAKKQYEEALAAGMDSAQYMLAYSVMLLRDGEYEKAKGVLVKTQKAPGLSDAQRQQLFMNYAVACYKLGDLGRAIELMEKQHQRSPSGLIFGTLGYLYVESGDLEKAKAFNQEALDYDDSDPIALDNMGQTLYRLAGDREAAKPYFEKALKEKSSQIDTLYFLAQYDIEEGNKEAAAEKLEKALEGRFSPLNHATRDKVQELLNQLKA